ncbi:hypothetical protein [Polaromonas glacialis]|uniref:hypothetical protein n=1 Tax=Polaromonas glacialis TaxID=866564 RepID=UPI0012EB726D|nr:hypothetical protein [Polaromonas glacialis]
MRLIKQRWVNAIWCDDIRHEVGNKPSFMGVYGMELVMPQLPAILSRLAVYVTVGTPILQPFQQLKVRIQRDDVAEALASIEIPKNELEVAAKEISEHLTSCVDPQELDSPTYIMSFILLVGPIQLNETTKSFKVWVDTELGTLESFKLKISSPAITQPVEC